MKLYTIHERSGKARRGRPYTIRAALHDAVAPASLDLHNNESVIIPFGKGTLRILLGEVFLFLKVKKFGISLAESRNVTTFVATPIAHEGLEGQILLEKGR